MDGAALRNHIGALPRCSGDDHKYSGDFFWLTPLVYFPEQLGQKRFIAEYNPFTHMIALVREPLMGGTPTLNDWAIVLAIAILGWIGTLLFFARYRARIVYWL